MTMLPSPESIAPGERVAIVTGGAQGIGKAIVQRLLDDGVRVVIADLDAEATEETVAEYRARGPVFGLPTDVVDEDQVAALVAGTVDRFGRLDILINNAATSANGPVTALSLADWNRVLATNLTGPFLCAKHCLPALQARRGTIVNIASTRALMSEADTEAYSASKGGLVALTHALAVSCGPEVRVNCISPGWIEVSAWKKAALRRTPLLTAQDHAQHPAGRVGTPEDIAGLVAYLTDPRNSFITGANFVVDGGMTRKMLYV